MLSRVGREFLTRMRPLFRGRGLLLTNTLSAGGLMAFGDFVQQSRDKHKNPDRVRDWRRTGCMFTVGCSLGPVLHYWYLWLDRAVLGQGLRTVGKKVLLDQILGSPFFGLWYFVGMSSLEGHTLLEGLKEFKEKFVEFYMVDCCVWPPAQMINFYFVPSRFRVLYINVITLGWDTYLSYLKHKDEAPPTQLLSHTVTGEQETSKHLEEKSQ